MEIYTTPAHGELGTEAAEAITEGIMGDVVVIESAIDSIVSWRNGGNRVCLSTGLLAKGLRP